MTPAHLDLALRYSRELDRCTQTGGASVEALMDLLAEDVVRVVDERVSEEGKDAVRQSFLARAGHLSQQVSLVGVDVWGDLVVCRIERRDTTMTGSGVEHHLRVLLIKDGLIRRITVITDPDEDARLGR